jgi:peptidoglycan/xylan/chitin deacetylase (PgdA/CDA1 family)
VNNRPPSKLKNSLLCAAARLCSPVFGGLGAILALHRAVPAEAKSKLSSNRDLEITPEYLDALLAESRRQGLRPVSIDDASSMLRSGRRERFVCFTFDDGYLDNLELALPVFQKHNAPFAVFVTTALVGESPVPWWYALEDLLFENTGAITCEWQGRRMSWPGGSHAAREAAFADIALLIRSLDNTTRDDFLARLFEGAGHDLFKTGRRLMMNWEKLALLAASPLVTIGSHTVQHHVLGNLSDDAVRHETLNSKLEIERRTGKPVRHFSYPFGGRNAVNEREMMIVGECGYDTMLTTRAGMIFPQHAKRLECLPRLTVTEDWEARSWVTRFLTGFEPARANHFRRVVTL